MRSACMLASASLTNMDARIRTFFKRGDKGDLVFDNVNIVIHWLFN